MILEEEENSYYIGVENCIKMYKFGSFARQGDAGIHMYAARANFRVEARANEITNKMGQNNQFSYCLR